MPALAATAFFFQDNVGLAQDVHNLVIAEWIIAICILIILLGIIGAILGAYLAIKNVQRKIAAITKDAQNKAMPLVAQGQDLVGKVQEIVGDLKPKIASVSSDVTHISGVVRAKIDEAGQTFSKVNETVGQVNGTVQDVNGKAKSQVQRVNGMVTDALTTTEHVSQQIQHGIKVPVQKIAGWVAAAKVSLESLAARTPFASYFTTTSPRTSSGPRKATTVAPGGPPFVPTSEVPNQ